MAAARAACRQNRYSASFRTWTPRTLAVARPSACCAAGAVSSRDVRECVVDDLVVLSTSDGSLRTAQVVSAWSQAPAPGTGSDEGASAVLALEGQLLRLSEAASGEGMQLERLGAYPPLQGKLASMFPAFRASLPDIQVQAVKGTSLELPSDGESSNGKLSLKVAAGQVVYSLGQLEAGVQADSALWCLGTQPGAPEKTELQALTLTAGELCALLQGQRGIATVQLWNGWDLSQGQPLFNPFVLTMVDQALNNPSIKACMSTAPGGVGLTLILYVDREPWSKWGPHLSSFGFQANAKAGSPYYKLLCGLILGYKEEYVRGYVQATSPPGSVTPVLMSQVSGDMAKLSKSKPKLPWNVVQNSRGKKKAKGAAK